MNFLLETGSGIINGSIKPYNDNFTSVSIKLHLASDVMNKLKSENDKVPDHSVLEFNFHEYDKEYKNIICEQLPIEEGGISRNEISYHCRPADI